MKKKLITTLTAIALCTNFITNINITTTSAASYEIIETHEVLTTEDSSTKINLDNIISIDGEGASVADNIVTITSAGTYNITGSLSDGQIIVNTKDNDAVRILLNGVNITSKSSSPIYTMKGTTIITLAEGSENIISDTSSYIYEDETSDEPDAAIFSKGDLIINGTGSLTVNGNYNTGIRSKDALTIESGNITINSVDDSIKGKDSVTILDGNINITSGADGIKSTSTKTGKGYIRIDGGTFNISAQNDGLQGEQDIIINNGDFSLITGSGSEYGKDHVDDSIPPMPGGDGNFTPPDGFNSGDGTHEPPSGDFAPGDGNQMPPNDSFNPGDPPTNPPVNNPADSSDTVDNETTSESKKGLKSGGSIEINGGTFNIDSADDAIHTNGFVTINDGNFTIATGDDALHADNTLEINNGFINITKSYEGLEATYININNGKIYVTSSDDGMNASVKVTSEETLPAITSAPNMPEIDTSNSTASLTINGGYIVVNAEGDGLDANGSIYINGGTTIVNGPTANNNAALDADVTIDVNGGTLIAAGSLGMVELPSSSSQQNVLNLSLTQKEAGTLVNIQSEDGDNILTFAPSKTYSSIIVSSPKLQTGKTYTVSVGGTSTGTSMDGLFTDGTYSNGSTIGSITISDTVNNLTQEGANVGGPGHGGPGGFIPGNPGETVPPSDGSGEVSDVPADKDTSTDNTYTSDNIDDSNISSPEDNTETSTNITSNSTKTGDTFAAASLMTVIGLSALTGFTSFKKKNNK